MLIVKSTQTILQYKQRATPVVLLAIVPLGHVSVQLVPSNRYKVGIHCEQGVGKPVHKVQLGWQARQRFGPSPPKV